MADYGIKVSQVGYNVKTATPSQLVFSSKYQTLKVHAQGTGAITHDGGRSATIAHGLGYVPTFLVHSQIDPAYSAFYGTTTDYFISPFRYGVGNPLSDNDVIASADSTNLYIKVRPDFGWEFFGTDADDVHYAWRHRGAIWDQGSMIMGYSDGREWDGALRFDNLTLANSESIHAAKLNVHFGSKTGSDDIKYTLYGIDEANTADFSSNPFSRNQTTASDSIQTNQGAGGNFTHTGANIKAIVDEIVAIEGWSSGDAIGFTMQDNGTPDGSYLSTTNAQDNALSWSSSALYILRSNSLLNYKYTIYKNQMNP